MALVSTRTVCRNASALCGFVPQHTLKTKAVFVGKKWFLFFITYMATLNQLRSAAKTGLQVLITCMVTQNQLRSTAKTGLGSHYLLGKPKPTPATAFYEFGKVLFSSFFFFLLKLAAVIHWSFSKYTTSLSVFFIFKYRSEHGLK